MVPEDRFVTGLGGKPGACGTGKHDAFCIPGPDGVASQAQVPGAGAGPASKGVTVFR